MQRERSEKTGTILKYSGRYHDICVNKFRLLFATIYRLTSTKNLFAGRVPYKCMGVVAYRWETPDRQSNERHDTFLYASAVGIKYGVSFISDQGWVRLRAEFEAPSPSRESDSAQEAPLPGEPTCEVAGA